MQLRGGGSAAGSFCLSENVTVIISPLSVVSAVHPNVGRAAGGEVIRLMGENLCLLPSIVTSGQLDDVEEVALKRGGPMCRFGDGNMVNALSVAQDCTWVECLSPPLDSNSNHSFSRNVEVSVSLDTSTYYLPSAVFFTYVDRPHLRAASPRFAAVASRGSVQNVFNLIGSGFEAGMQCKFEFELKMGVNKSMKISSVATVLTSSRAFCPAPLQASPGLAKMWLFSAAGE